MTDRATIRPTNGRIAVAFAAMLSVYFLSYFQRAAIPGTIFNEIQSDLRLSASAVTALGSMFIAIYAVMQLFVGMAADRFGGGRTLLFGGCALAVGALLFPLSHSAWTLYGSRAITGFGASFMYLSMVKEVDRLFGHRRFATLMGVVLFAGYLGGMAGMLPFERAVEAWGWRHTLLGIAGLTFGCLALAALALRRMDGFVAAPRFRLLAPLRDILATPDSRPLLVIALVNFPIYFVIQAAVGQKFLQDYARLSSAAAAGFATVMMLLSASITAVGGFALAWVGHRRKPFLVAACVLVTASTLLLLAGVLVGAPGWVFLVAYGLLALACVASPANLAAMKEVNRPDGVALAIGVINGVSYAGVAVLMAVSGAVLDAFRGSATVTPAGVIYPPAAYAALFAILLVVALVGLAASRFVRETRGRPAWEAAARQDANSGWPAPSG